MKKECEKRSCKAPLFTYEVMKAEFYRKWFDRTAFPVIIANTSGTIVYKNPSAIKHLPMLRKGADIRRRLCGKMPLSSGMDAELSGKAPYRRAAVFSDEEMFIFLFLSRLQYPDSDRITRILTDTFGTKLSDLLASQEQEASLPYDASCMGKNRIYADLLDICGNKSGADDAYVYDIQEVTEKLFSRLKDAFRALGYRISVKNLQPREDKTYIKFNLYDFIFVLSRLLYIQMKRSENGIIGIEAAFDEDYDSYEFRFTARTSLSPTSVKGKNAADFLTKLAPECTFELKLFQNIDILFRNTKISVDKYGKFIIEYRLNLTGKPAVLHIRSVDFSDAGLERVIDSFLDEMKSVLKNHS